MKKKIIQYPSLSFVRLHCSQVGVVETYNFHFMCIFFLAVVFFASNTVIQFSRYGFVM
jgi:hypothetical protein